ncbi:MAG: shikimate dehydrogenase [Bifidobacteriaceae bacterium]|nr:shikimate dehydrogenase [Bifidobacteriaceae bacterium]
MTEAGNLAAVLGKPIAHSLSPLLHTAAYEALGIAEAWSYGRREVAEAELAHFIETAVQPDSKWRGLSLTMPLKKQIFPMGTARDKWSSFLQIANTVVFRRDDDGHRASATTARLDLYNTDVFGIEAALNDGEQPDSVTVAPVTRPCMIIGSGNTASSALAALGEAGLREVVFAARTPSKTRHLLEMSQRLGISARAIPLAEAGEQMRGAQYVVSTLPSHAADGVAADLIRGGIRLETTTVLDVVYDPRPSDLLRVAGNCGAVTVGGERMLLWQAVAQVALMVGVDQKDVPVRAMRAALNAVVGEAERERK